VEQVDVFSLIGSLFQALGAATEKALSVHNKNICACATGEEQPQHWFNK